MGYSEHVDKMTDTRKQMRRKKKEEEEKKSIRNADQALTVRGELADRIVGSPGW